MAINPTIRNYGSLNRYHILESREALRYGSRDRRERAADNPCTLYPDPREDLESRYPKLGPGTTKGTL